MKKILLLSLLIVSFLSCNDDDFSDDNFYLEFVPIESVDMPNEFMFNEVYTIDFTFKKPSTCHFFHNLYYNAYGDNRTVAVIDRVVEEGLECEDLDGEIDTNSFNFICTKEIGSYTFEFWNGVDDDGNDVYLTFEVPVRN